MTITLPAGMCRQLLDKAAAGRHPSRIAQELGIPIEAATAGVAWTGAPSLAKLAARRAQLAGLADTVPVEISTSTITATPAMPTSPAPGRRFDRVQLVGIDELVTDTSPAPIRNLADRIRALVDRLNHGITEDAQHAANRLKLAQLRAEIRRLEASLPSSRRRPPATTAPAGVHACPHCDQTFTRTNGLTRHINHTHKEHTS